MRRLVVQQDTIGGWDVHDLGSSEQLCRGDRIRAEGFARRLCAAGGGTVVVVGNNGLVLAEYTVPVATRAPLRGVVDPPRPRRRGWVKRT